ncbi:MAG: hypothetical protein M0R17_05520 [Candidatus Omnitrophica bacterium]|jgi:hypothetical protein|nr:hypothetical protein [Candidatus Omnitrophota bacterium]
MTKQEVLDNFHNSIIKFWSPFKEIDKQYIPYLSKNKYGRDVIYIKTPNCNNDWIFAIFDAIKEISNINEDVWICFCDICIKKDHLTIFLASGIEDINKKDNDNVLELNTNSLRLINPFAGLFIDLNLNLEINELIKIIIDKLDSVGDYEQLGFEFPSNNQMNVRWKYNNERYGFGISFKDNILNN